VRSFLPESEAGHAHFRFAQPRLPKLLNCANADAQCWLENHGTAGEPMTVKGNSELPGLHSAVLLFKRKMIGIK
jgi:hypothetical protein